tara:strand:- start:566 stop:1648 length:1083 start_codon:yes stop_codon:yes gene_type:complete
MNNSKILFVMPTLKKDGAEVQIANLISYFKHFQIDIFTFDLYKEGDSIINQLDGIKIFTNHGLSTIVSLNKVINENNYKIVHSHLPKADFYVGLLKFFGNKFNHIITVHAQYGDRTGESKIKYFIFNIFWKVFLNKSDGIIAISQKINKWLTNNKSIDENKIATIHYGIKIDKQIKKINNKKIVGMAARMLPWKGWDKVIETASILNELNPNYKFLLAGSDDQNYKSELQDLIENKNLVDMVLLHDHYSNIEEFFSKIDLFLFLSESEGFGLVVLEAIQNNTPVVCSNIEPLSEFVDNSHGTLVDRNNVQEIANLINSIFSSDELLNKIQIKQKNKIVKEFSIISTAKKYENYYINLLNN